MANEAPALIAFALFLATKCTFQATDSRIWRGAGYVVARPLIQVKEPRGWWSIDGVVGMVAGVLLLAIPIRITILSTKWKWIGWFFESFKVQLQSR
jgi:hypothetical protein